MANEPDLMNNIDTYIPFSGTSHDELVDVLRNRVIKPIRELQDAGLVGWFSFLLHNEGNMPKRDSPVAPGLHIHIRMSPLDGVLPDEVITKLPSHFEQPIVDPLSAISGVDQTLLTDQDWAYGWKMVGASAEWAASLIECHSGSIPPPQIFQFMHFITNALSVAQCLYLPNGSMRF